MTEEAPNPIRASARRASPRRRKDDELDPTGAVEHTNGHLEPEISKTLTAADFLARPVTNDGAGEIVEERPRRRTVRSRSASAEAPPAEATPQETPPTNSTTFAAPSGAAAAAAGTESSGANSNGSGPAGNASGQQAQSQQNQQGPREERWGRRDRNRDRDRQPRQGGGNDPNRRQDRPFNRRDGQGQGFQGQNNFNDRRDRAPLGQRSGQDEEAFEREEEAAAAERSGLPSVNVAEMQVMAPDQLEALALQMGVPEPATIRKQDLIVRMLQVQAESRGNIFSGGYLEVSDDGNYGFLRGERMLPGPHDIFVSQQQLRRWGLRPGDYLTCQVRQPRDNEKYYGLLKVEAVNGVDPEEARRRPYFENLTAIFPKEQLKLETTPDNLTHRIIDLIAPVGRGQRGLIVSPPKAGKTMLLKNIANGITANHPDVHLIVLLVGERPEEVTDMQRTVRGEVVSSTFDEPVEDHTRVAEMALERAKRLVETGKDVVIMLDSITRLTRAYNTALPSSGRTLSGGVDPVALYPPKRLFGAARKCEEGGSLTIIATCLVDTGSRMDEVVFEEFKGTGNWELRLDRRLAERRFYPAIDIQASSTRREELLLDEKTLKGVWLMRRMTAMISQNSPNQLEATERLLERIARTTTNEEFVNGLKTDL